MHWIQSLGEIDTYFLDRIRLEFSRDAHGALPNEAFFGIELRRSLILGSPKDCRESRDPVSDTDQSSVVAANTCSTSRTMVAAASEVMSA